MTRIIDPHGTVGLRIKDFRDIISGKMCDDNANLQKNPETFHKQVGDTVAKEYYLKTLPENVAKAHIDGDYHLHNLEYLGTRAFCRSWDLRPILMYGFRPDGGTGAIDAGPAMHAAVAILQATKTLAMGQTQHSGGQGLLYGLVFLSPFMAGKSYKEIKQLMQMMIYELNQMYISRGGQVIFSSINISPGVPKILENVPVVYQGILWDGEVQAYGKVDNGIYADTIVYPRKVYGDYEREVRLMFKAIMEISMEGDIDNKPFPFPKLEVSVENKFINPDNWDNQVISSKDEFMVVPSYKTLYKLCFDVASKFGSIYFDNLLIDGKSGDNVVGCSQCSIHPDTLIQIVTNNGIKLTKIAEVSLDDVVNTPMGYSKFEDMLIHDITHLKEVVLHGGKRILITDDHKMPIDGYDNLIQGKDLHVGDNVIINNYIPVANVIPKYNNAIIYGDEYDLQLSYLLGLFAAEGSSSVSNVSTDKHLYWCFGSHELNLINKTKNIIHNVFGYEAKETHQNHGKGLTVCIHSNNIYGWFVEQGIILKGYKMEVPPFIFTAPYNCRWAFLQGYFQGDGSLRRNGKTAKNRRIELNTISEKLAVGILLLAGSMGYKFNYGIYDQSKRGRKTRYVLTMNKQADIQNFFGGKYSEPVWKEPIEKITDIEYDGLVYDPINVNGHLFITGQGLVSSNCAYQFRSDAETDINFDKKLKFEDDHHFNLGGYDVVSLNLPRLAYKSEHDDKVLIARIYDLMDLAVEVFKIKKEMIHEQSKNGSLTFINQITPKGVRFTNWDELVFEMGIVGFAEMLEYHYGRPVITDFGIDEEVLEDGKNILDQMREYCKLLSEFHGVKIVLSRTPAETTAQRFAVCDLMSEEYREFAKPLIKGDMETAIDKMGKTRNLPIYYSNGFAPDVECNVHYRLRVESEFWQYTDGGAITHIWLSEEDPDPESLMEFTLKLLKNSNIGYLTYTKDLSECALCHKMMGGIQEKCKYCGHDVIIIRSRITGYYSVAGILTKGIFNRRWNAGKAEELFNRRKITMEELNECI
jgi:anaerobic ribonucleoside-triphosphate reductase/intein/homing endonuclease